MRQRHSQGYVSSGDDLEDDACSRPVYFSPSLPNSRTWFDILEVFLWIASVVFIIYYGDRHSNFIYLLWHDDRVRRFPLYMGVVCVSLDLLFFFYKNMLTSGGRSSSLKWEISSMAALPFITMLGLISFCLFCFALWPIWSFLTLPLVFTLFMACIVTISHLILGTFKQPPELLRQD